MRHIANYMADKDKLFLANTHPAVDNMRRKVSSRNCEYSTIARFLAKTTGRTQYDILFVDECSTVSNEDMYRLLQKAKFKLLVLVGDTFQIESIYFGNWFDITKRFIPDSSVFELTHPYRTEEKELLTIWDRVRNLDDSMLEPLVKSGCVSKLDDSIFIRTDEDEIVLCLNYDGLYGINNLNRFLQGNNQNESVLWGLNSYKVGDPILFNESNLFAPLIHNNSKGTIVRIELDANRIWFDIELEDSINELDAEGYEFELVGESEKGRSIIRFYVNKNKGSDEDEEEYDSTVVPFQVAYAISIHKAQGLEFNSVKIVITSEIEERITHNIFYTAITRARKNLKVYWSPETEEEVLENMKLKDYDKDAALLAQLYSLRARNNSNS